MPPELNRRKVAVVSGSRADYGHLYWILRHIQDDADLELLLIATGMHLSPEHGLTWRVIEEDGFTIAGRVECLLSSDTRTGMSSAVGLGVLGFTGTYEKLRPDLVVLLGDRFEIFSAAAAAIIMEIPIAHIHGGETSEGAVDESIRHAITKMSHLHFAANERYRKRIIQMGESPQRVFCYGAPGLDHLAQGGYLSREEVESFFKMSKNGTLFLITYHPVTHEQDMGLEALESLLSAMDAFPEANLVFTMPNADAGGRKIASKVKAFVSHRPARSRAFDNLGQRRYLSLLRYADVVLGNSSSGLIEAPAFKVPTVNIGDRQKGRDRGASVIDCAGIVPDIRRAIEKALSPQFRAVVEQSSSPYGAGGASLRIKNQLKEADLGAGIHKKSFHDIPFELE